MSDYEHHTINANGIRIHYVAKGDGPLVVLCHGWPESWYSWRHQIDALADAGYRAVAPDMRGYGRTSRPEAVSAYDLTHLIGDIVGLVNAIGADKAVVVGHDWGAPVAWSSALARPDLFRAVAGLSVPFRPPMALPPGISMSDLMRAQASDGDHYRLFFADGRRAEADFEKDVRRYITGVLYSISGDIGPGKQFDGILKRGQNLTDALTVPDQLPDWVSPADIEFYVAEFERTGLTGGFNYYRNIDALPACLAPFLGQTIEQPSFYIGGEFDLIAGNTPDAHQTMRASLPDLRGLHILEGAGHWIQRERAATVSALLTGFLDGLF